MQHWLLPAWFINQSDLNHSDYIQDRVEFYNRTSRNWTSLRAERDYLFLDRQAVCYLPEWQISLEFWIDTGVKLFIPGDFEVSQFYLRASAGVESECKFTGGVLAVRIEQGQGVGRDCFQIELNLSIQPGWDLHALALLVLLRPYGPDGIGRVRRLEYQNRQLLVDGSGLISLITEPDHTYFSDAGNGDPIQYFRRGEGNGEFKSKDGSCTALLGFLGLSGELNGVKLGIRPRGTNPAKLLQNKVLSLSKGKSQFQVGTCSSKTVFKAGATVADLWRVTREHLMVFCPEHPRGVNNYQLLALNRWGYHNLSRIYLEESLRRISWDGRGRKGWLGAAKLIWGLNDYLTYSGDWGFGARVWPVIKWVGFWLERRLHEEVLLCRSQSKSKDDFEEALWNCAALKAMSYLGQSLGKTIAAMAFTEGYQRYWGFLLEELARATKRAQESLTPGEQTGGEGGYLVRELVGCYPLGLFSTQESYISDTIKLVKDYYLINGGVVSPFKFKGIDLELTSRLAQILVVAGEDYRPSWELLLGSAGSTWSWPDRINPRTGRGIGCNGHDPGVLYQVLILLHCILVNEADGILELLPGVWGSLFWERPDIKVENLPSRFGTISLECLTMGNFIQLTYHPIYRIQPEKVRLRLAGRYRAVATDGVYREHLDYLELEPGFSYLRLERNRFESLS